MPGIGVGSAEEKKFRGFLGEEDEGKRAQRVRAGSNEVK